MILFMISIDKIKISELAQKHGLLIVVLFGSQASGKTHLGSDVDLGFISEKSVSPADIAKMTFEFTEKLGVKNLELIDLAGAPPLLLKQVVQKSVLLYERETALFAKFRIYAIKLFMEAKKLLDLRETALNKFLQKI